MPNDNGVVSLTIDYSNGIRKEFSRIPWSTGIDILGALEAAKSQPPGLAFETWTSRADFRGVGAVDGVPGFPTGGSDRWLAWVNSRFIGAMVQPAIYAAKRSGKP